jgi:carboxymethylenebutenolidase
LKEGVMPKASRHILFSAVAVSVGAFALGRLGIVSEDSRVLAALAAEGASTVAAKALVSAPGVMPLGLPDAKEAKAVLSASLIHHHPQWIDVPMGAAMIRTFVIYPDLSGTLPVAVVTDRNQAMSDWARAVGTEVVKEGFITVVPDLLSGIGPHGGGTDSFGSREAVAQALSRVGADEIARRTSAVRDYFANQPGSNGDSVTISFNWGEGRIETSISTLTQHRVVRFDVTEHAWHNTLALLTNMAPPSAALQADTAGIPKPKDDAALTASAARQRAAQQEIAKRDDIPPGNLNGPGKVADQSPRHGRWIDIPATLSTGAVMMRTWVVEPLGTDRAGVVVVIHPGPGMDIGGTPKKGGGADWMRALADKVALQGFIVVMPDLASGMGPGGGNFDSFQYSDDLAKALGSRSGADKMQLVRTARDYALKLPRANGKSGITGFCNGGGMAWESTAAIAGFNAAVSFYGAPPDAATMAKIQAPVLAFAGDDDPGLAPRVSGAASDMQRLGKTFEFKIYPNVTHAYLHQQTLGENAVATLDSWTRAIAFFKRYLS